MFEYLLLATYYFTVRQNMPVFRVMIIGGPGSGKTMFGGQLSRQLDLPVFSVDEAVWDCDGSLKPVKSIDAIVRAKIAEERCIIEGGNTRTYKDRALRSHLIIRLNPPLWPLFIRVLRRDGPKFRLRLWTLKYDKVFGIKDQAILSFAQHTKPPETGQAQAEGASTWIKRRTGFDIQKKSNQ